MYEIFDISIARETSGSGYFRLSDCHTREHMQTLENQMVDHSYTSLRYSFIFFDINYLIIRACNQDGTHMRKHTDPHTHTNIHHAHARTLIHIHTNTHTSLVLAQRTHVFANYTTQRWLYHTHTLTRSSPPTCTRRSFKTSLKKYTKWTQTNKHALAHTYCDTSRSISKKTK